MGWGHSGWGLDGNEGGGFGMRLGTKDMCKIDHEVGNGFNKSVKINIFYH